MSERRGGSAWKERALGVVPPGAYGLAPTCSMGTRYKKGSKAKSRAVSKQPSKHRRMKALSCSSLTLPSAARGSDRCELLLGDKTGCVASGRWV